MSETAINKEELINSTEKKTAQFLWELLCLNYDKETEYEIYIERARKLQREETTFKGQNEPLKKICIYQSESPSLFINMETNEVESDDTIMMIGVGLYEESFYDGSKDNLYSDLETALGYELDEFFTIPAGIADEDFYFDSNDDNCGGIKDEGKFASFAKDIGDSPYNMCSISEALFYYRQAMILKKRILESGLFSCGNDLKVTAATHDAFEFVNTGLWDFAGKSIDKDIAEVYRVTGIL